MTEMDPSRLARRLCGVLRGPAVNHPFTQMVRYGIVVGCGFLLSIVLYALEINIGIPAYVGLAVVFVLNGVFNFVLVRIWAFPPSGRSFGADFARFAAVAAVSFVVNYASFAALYSGVGLAATTSQRLAILIAAPVTFLANRLWSFRARGGRRARDAGPSVGGRRGWARQRPLARMSTGLGVGAAPVGRSATAVCGTDSLSSCNATGGSNGRDSITLATGG